MSDDRHQTSECLDAEELAAFMDGRLEPRARAAVEAHLADCEDCYEVWMEGRDVSRCAETSPAAPQRSRYSTTRAALAIAAVAILAVGTQYWRPTQKDEVQTTLNSLLVAVGSARSSEGQLSAPQPWAPSPTSSRGSDRRDLSLEAEAAAIKLQQLASSTPSVESNRAAGISLLLLGNVEGAIEQLEIAVASDPGDWRPLVDLSAALLEQFRQRGQAFDAARALNAAQSALTQRPNEPSALFNKAVAAEAVGSHEVARETWDRYLAIVPTGPWSDEARQRASRLQPGESGQNLRDGDFQGERRNARLGESPVAAERRVLASVLREWARNPTASQARVAQDEFLSLSQAGYRSPLALLAQAAVDSESWPSRRRDCLREAIGAAADWYDLFSSIGSAAAAKPAATLAAAVHCARIDAAPALVPDAWAALIGREVVRTEQLAQEALARADAMGADRMRAEALELLGAVATDRGALTDASEFRVQSLRLAERLGDVRAIGRLTRLLGELASEQGDFRNAWQYFQNGLKTLDEVPDAGHRYGVLSTSVIAAAHARLPGLALALSDSLIAAAEATGRDTAKAMAFLQRGRAWAAAGQRARGIVDIESGVALIDALPEGALRDAWRAEAGWLKGVVLLDEDPAASIESITIAIDYFARTNRPFRLAELLLYRGRAHRHAGSLVNATRDWLRGAAVLEDQRTGIRHEQLRISRASNVWGIFSDLIDSHTNDSTLALEILERARARELLDYLPTNRTVEARLVTQLQGCLPADGQALIYASLETRLIIWHVTRTSITLHTRWTGRRALEGHTKAFLRELQSGQSTIAATELGTMLLPPELAAIRPDTSLVIVPDGPLHLIPFAALAINGEGERFVQRASPLMSPSLTTFCRASSAAAPDRRLRSALLVGVDSGFGLEGLPDLPMVVDEVAALAELYPSSNVLVGKNATKSAILAAMPFSRTIHIASHAILDPFTPSQSRLFTYAGKDRQPWFVPADISALRLQPGTLVIIAACETASGETFVGEGPFSFTRAFLAAGAQSVLGTLWNIRDGEAMPLLAAVHRRANAGDSLELAVAATQREYIRSGAPAATWSGYVVTGGTNAAVIERGSNGRHVQD